VAGFGSPVPDPAVESGLVALEARMVAAERKTTNLEAEIAQVKREQAQIGLQVWFDGNSFGQAGIGSWSAELAPKLY
jgi:hypothetical protein